MPVSSGKATESKSAWALEFSDGQGGVFIGSLLFPTRRQARKYFLAHPTKCGARVVPVIISWIPTARKPCP